MRKVSSLFAVVFLAVFSKPTNCTDPCSSALNIGDSLRSEDYVTELDKVVLCDVERIKEGNWYRFDAHTGNKMATSHVPSLRCGTINTMYMLGDSHPNASEPGPVNATVCENVDYEDCAHSHHIRVEWCYDNTTNEEYFAYQLAAPRFCETAYCVGTGQPCPAGQYYNTSTQSCIGIDECASNPCMNGVCESLQNEYNCQCQPGYTGNRCIDECASNPCINGVCESLQNEYKCQCEPDYTGNRCELEINECASQPCHHGHCKDSLNGYQCVCHDGYTGSNCDTKIDVCESAPCANNGTCTSSYGSWYYCNCAVGYRGWQCTEGEWNSWSLWSDCSETCGYGYTFSERSCMVEAAECYGESIKYTTCIIDLCSDEYDIDGSEIASNDAYIEVLNEEFGQVIKNEIALKIEISDSINRYCASSPDICCHDLGMAHARYVDGNLLLTNQSLVTIENDGLYWDWRSQVRFLIRVDAFSNSVSSMCYGNAPPSGYVSLPGILTSKAMYTYGNIMQVLGVSVLTTGTEEPHSTGIGKVAIIIISLAVVIVVGGVAAIAVVIYLKKRINYIKKNGQFSALSQTSNNKVPATSEEERSAYKEPVEIYTVDYPQTIPLKDE